MTSHGRATAPVLLIHGGAGVPAPADLPPEWAAEARAGLDAALRAGHAVLAEGGSALDAVEIAVRAMEDAPVFNAGVGGTLTTAGHVEHDACIMDGRDRRAGAVTGTRRVRSPIRLARLVMEEGRNVLLAGEGAEAFARESGLEPVDPAIFVTPRRQEALRKMLRGTEALDEADRHGTVGAVALDRQGHLAAATSTGGRTGKRPGRIGDSPIPGAGTWAQDGLVAASGTGSGEHFLRSALCHRIADLVELAGLPLHEASDRALAEMAALGGSGGVIALGASGAWAMPYDTPGMYRGLVDATGERRVAIHA
ncbi:isoaspartyl peptidase/L-asparaginase family protein [Muricoccus radiodurans]|uniref:isoaspartyl peptidase/L-asparaginase family protein n=1 Tax=Muricoccus radiodurans TaxID=2231721 RepID=UPI003CEDBFB6